MITALIVELPQQRHAFTVRQGDDKVIARHRKRHVIRRHIGKLKPIGTVVIVPIVDRVGAITEAVQEGFLKVRTNHCPGCLHVRHNPVAQGLLRQHHTIGKADLLHPVI